MDSAFAKAVADFDISHGADLYSASRCNILVGNLRRWNEQILATIFEAPLCNLQNWNGNVPEEVATDKDVIFTCPSTIFDEIFSQNRVLLYDVELQAQRDSTPSNALYVEIKERSIIIPWGTVTTNFWMLDLCCGGYGGWQYGFRNLEKHGLPFHYCIGIDHDLPMCTMHAVNHHTTLVPNETLPADFFLKNRMHSTINATISSIGWKQAVATIRPDRWFFSFPCQSWSTSASAKGFGDGNGQVFIQGMLWARVYRPKTIGLENVKGFPNHRQFPLAMELIKHCGFRIVHQGVYDAADRIPSRRVRWLALLERIEEPPHQISWQSWGDANKSSPMTWNAWFPTTEGEFKDFTLPPDHRALYMDPDLLPNGAPNFAKSNMHRYRVPQICMKTPVFMATYGEHHCLPEDFLRSKGLHGFFAAEHLSFRWYQPAEIALLHMQLNDMILLAPKSISWRALGNSIIMHHATLMIGNLLSYEFPTGTPFKLDEVMTQIESNRLRATETTLIKDEFAWYLGSAQGVQQKQRQLHFLANAMGWEGDPKAQWKKGVFFHPALGCLSLLHSTTLDHEHDMQISPTLPYVIETEIHESKEDANQEVTWDPYLENDLDMKDAKLDSRKQCTVSIAMDAEPFTYGELLVHQDIKMGTLMQIWGTRFIPPILDERNDDERFHEYDQKIQETDLIPYVDANCQLRGLIIDESHILLVDQIEVGKYEDYIDLRTIALEIPYECTWKQMIQEHPYLSDYPYDDCGLIAEHFKPDEHVRIFKQPNKTSPLPMAGKLLKAMDEVRVEYRMLPRADNIVITMHGSKSQLQDILHFWNHACNDEWLAKHHRKIYIQVIDDSQIRLIFAPTGTGFATPSHLLPRALALQLFRTACVSLEQSDGNITVILKIDGRHFAEICIRDDFSFAPVLLCLKHSFVLQSHGFTPSIVAAGRRIADAMTGKDLPTKLINNCQAIVGHITMPVFGGAGNQKEHKQNVMAGLATMCLNAGIQLSEVPSAVQTITTQIGIPRLTHLIYMEDSEVKVEHFLQFCHECDIKIPKTKVQVMNRQNKVQKTSQDRQHKAMRNLDVSQYSLQFGFFTDSTGTPVNIHASFSPCNAGVTMMSPSDAEKWLKQHTVLMPEPIAIFVVGDIELETCNRITKLVAPAINQDGQHVLIGGYLVQMGEQLITTATQDEHIQTRDVQLCAFTMWKDDFSQDEWKQVTSSPVRFAKHLLEPDGMQHCIRTPYGRAFRKGDKPCAPDESLSVQFHSEVWVQDLRKVLRRSGFNRLFITPKENGGKPTNKWKPIWTDIPKPVLEAKFVAHPATAGFIRGKKSTGIRVEISAFEEMWAKIKPDVPVPQQIPEGKLWKVQPMPFGVDKDIVNEWAANVKWEAHAIRPLGPKAWILSSAKAPPEGILSFNDHPLLVRPLKPKHSETSMGLVAGPKSQGKIEQSTSSTKNPLIFRTGDPFLDPWHSYQKKEETQSAGPTSQYFQHHDKRLDDLEKHVEQLREASSQTRNENNQRFASLEDKIVQQNTDTKNAFTSLRADFETTLTQAMQRQDSQIASSMDEIKNLLLRRDKRKATEAEDMDD